MKKIKILFATLMAVASVTFLHAQDLNSAIEAYNLGATAAQDGNYVTAIEHLNQALDLGNAFGEEGLSVVSDCKNLIPQLYLRHGKELAAGGSDAAIRQHDFKTQCCVHHRAARCAPEYAILAHATADGCVDAGQCAPR